MAYTFLNRATIPSPELTHCCGLRIIAACAFLVILFVGISLSHTNRNLVLRKQFDSTAFGFKPSEGVFSPTHGGKFFTEVKKQGRAQEIEVGPLSRQFVEQSALQREIEVGETQRMEEGSEVDLASLEIVNVSGTEYNLTAMMTDLWKRRGIDPDENIRKTATYPEPETTTPMYEGEWYKPCNQWRWFKMKNYEMWENQEIEDAKEREMIKDGRWLKMLQRESPEGFKSYVQVGEEILHINVIARRPILHKNKTFLKYLNETSPTNFKKLMRMKKRNLTEDNVLIPVPAHQSYIEWRNSMTRDELKNLNREQDMDFTSKIRKVTVRRPRKKGVAQKSATRSKRGVRVPKTWKPKGIVRTEEPYKPLIPWEHKMVLKSRQKERSRQRQIDLQRRKEWRTLEAKRILAAQRKKREAREQSSVKVRLTGKAKERLKGMKKKDLKRMKIKTVPDSEQFFKF
mmetsp:Transcript_9820/g.24162  ORF Transcript_9820/g.24162 Transcript_9820/m.24162 type:complete len:457 (+) Transcript_9820:333-1703(+)|eukprot:CAMPEP_0114507186 /NCGR_PEP_ID=MMETSP0109-20121206/11868_1 /TAXON_ID=29199 /ORGANISM="Chlorarachnion reptans, Strain CCCM449" /LENGTH=456 /DNA_ID=CAMNT_0001685907 /DNA_START=293 /DNA_END=1663 /DNA_ORIENTATION=-